MDINDFLNNEASTFQPGEMVIVTGTDPIALSSLMGETQAFMESGGTTAVVYDSRQTVTREFFECTAFKFYYPGACHEETLTEGLPWEGYAYDAVSSGTVILVSNTLAKQYQHPGLPIATDVALDILDPWVVFNIFFSMSTWLEMRALFPYISRIYYYDSSIGDITFIKDQGARQLFTEAVPTLTAVVPSTGPAMCNQQVALIGQGFYTGSSIKIGSNPAIGENVVDTGTIEFLVPPLPVGTYDITVTTPSGITAILQSGFTLV